MTNSEKKKAYNREYSKTYNITYKKDHTNVPMSRGNVEWLKSLKKEGNHKSYDEVITSLRKNT